MSNTIPLGYGQIDVIMRHVSTLKQSMFTWGYDGDAAFDVATDALEVATILTATGRLLHPSAYSSQYILDRVRATRMLVDGPLSADAPVGVAGSTSQDCAPPNVALLVRKRTLAGGRENRGRMYLPPCFVTEANISSSGVIGAGDVAVLQPRINSTLSDLLTSDCPPVLLHSGVTPPTPIVQWSLDPKVATQRRRLR